MIPGSRQWYAAFGRLVKMLTAAEHAGDTARAHKLRLSIRNFKMITGDKGRNRNRAPAAHRVVKHRSSKMNEIDKTTEGGRKKPPVTVARIPSLDRPLPPEDATT